MQANSSENMFFFAWMFTTLLSVYKIIWEIYLYILAIIVLYILYKVLAKKYINRIEIVGQGILITGCDTGLGHDTALRLAKTGFTVFAGCLKPEGEGATALREKGGERLHVVPLDVTSDESVNQAVDIVKSQ
ncbi:estradiol 17-beta-dehydrogenase 2-like [Mercenaria mercenaria]|uniref:estradiol 17-beta-dehydrogenase 2-like n=1 Tax=Mercenaria mercenaria TaxID=6596 RepID=UPI00234F3CE3|nr:estradiol 17-beta-dehydrogenase 2-like [Mercenaria mercenaria]